MKEEMKKETYYLPGYQKKSRSMTLVIVGIVLFVGVIFPFFAVNPRYQVGYIFSQIFDSIGMFCLTLGGILTLFSILSLFFQRSLNIRYFIMGVVFYTGLGGKLVGAVAMLTGQMILPALVLTMVANLILGLALPVTASYILTALLIVPATIVLGDPPMAAHLLCIYFAAV